jgi:hypothetical protein
METRAISSDLPKLGSSTRFSGWHSLLKAQHAARRMIAPISVPMQHANQTDQHSDQCAGDFGALHDGKLREMEV